MSAADEKSVTISVDPRPQSRRLLEIALPVVLTTVGFWGLQQLELMADTPLWVLVLLVMGGLALTETIRAFAPRAMRTRVVALNVASGAIIYATGWGPVLVIGFMYGVATAVRTFGARAVRPAVIATLMTIAAGQFAIGLDIAPSVIGEGRLAHGLASLGGLGMLFPSWVVYTTAARKEASENQLVHQAFYDQLTGLPNRTRFLNRLDHALGDPAATHERLGILFVDLDRFKIVNDSLGHEIGDLLLSGVAERIAASVRPGDTVARFGGDEFVVLLENIDNVDDAVQVARRIGDELRLPFYLKGSEVVTRASVGIAAGTRDGPSGDDDAERLVRDADVAMYHAKRRGGATFEIYNEEMGRSARLRLTLEGRLRRAIDNRDFSLLYQPEVAVASGDVVGVEALVRWDDPDHGEVPLGDVISVAEETGLIIPLGRWVLEHAAEQARHWFDTVPPERPAVVAVNISNRQFMQPALPEQVSAVLGMSGLEPRRLRLEITESAVMYDHERGAATIRELKDLGVQIALDDFGTGHSSLAALSTLPADILKIDRAFVDRIDERDIRVIVETVTTMAHGLDLRVVAEGVETEGQLRVLQSLGCDTVQGYLLSPPVSADEAAALLRRDGLTVSP